MSKTTPTMDKLNHHFIERGKIGVLYLHGFMGKRQDMLPIVSPKACALLIDLPGHGKNTAPKLFEQGHFLGLLDELLQSLPVKEWIFYGYSMGGRLLLEYLKGPFLRPRLLILESVGPGGGGNEQRKRAQALAKKLERADERQMAKFFRQWYAMPLFAKMPQHPDYESFIAKKDIANSKNWAKALMAFSQAKQETCFGSLLPRPKGAYLFGLLDKKYTALAKEFEQKLDFEIYPFPHASHNVHFFYPKQIKKLIEDKIAEIS